MLKQKAKRRPRPRLPPLDLNQRYTVPEAAEYLRVCVATVNIYIAQNTLKTIKDGGRRFVPGSEIARRSAAPSAA
jgi:excisionase family DNA binding protein